MTHRRKWTQLDVKLDADEALVLIRAVRTARFIDQQIVDATIDKILESAPFRAETGSDHSEGDGAAPDPLLGVSVLSVVNAAERKLRKVVYDTPSKEQEIQDAFETLLLASDIPFSREKVAFDYSSRSYRPDFVVDGIDLVIEIKFCNKSDREKEIVCEINDDRMAYETRYRNVLFVVYDVGCIRDVDRFVGEFDSHDHVVIKVIKH
jgi:hypothetical protein